MTSNAWKAVAFIAMATVIVILIGGSLLLGTSWGFNQEHTMWNFGGINWPIMIFMMVIPIGLVVLGVFTLVWLMQNKDTRVSPRPETALEILKKRYAKGEISKVEFDQTKIDI